MVQHSTILLLQLLLLAAQSFGDGDVHKLLHVDFGNNRASEPPTITLSEEPEPDILCSDATFPTGTFCDFQLAFQKLDKRFPNLNGTARLTMNFPHPSFEDTVCKMTFIGVRYETPARVLYENISCTPEVADQSVPPVKMTDVTSLEMKLFGEHLVCSLSVNNKTVLSSGKGEQNDYPMVGFLSFNSTCALPVIVGRPLVPKVVTVHLPDRIRDRPVDD